MLALITQGASFGLVAGVLPGPFQAYIINCTLMLGWRKSLKIAFAPVIADIPIIIICAFLLRQIPPEAVRILQIVGGLYSMLIAYSAYRDLRAGTRIAANTSEAVQERSLRQALLMIWLGPNPWLFWSTMLGPLLVQGMRDSPFTAIAFLLSFYGLFIGFVLLTIAIFNRMRQLDPRLTTGILLLTIVVLALFSVSLIAQGLGLLA